MVLTCAVCGDKFGVEAAEICDECRDKEEGEQAESDRDSAAERLLDALRAKVEKWRKQSQKNAEILPPRSGSCLYFEGMVDAYDEVRTEIDRAMRSTDQFSGLRTKGKVMTKERNDQSTNDCNSDATDVRLDDAALIMRRRYNVDAKREARIQKEKRRLNMILMTPELRQRLKRSNYKVMITTMAVLLGVMMGTGSWHCLWSLLFLWNLNIVYIEKVDVMDR